LHGSGTSLVHRWLRAHPEVTGFAQTGAPEDEGQHLQDALPTARSLGGLGRFGFEPGAHLTEASGYARPEVAQRLLDSWETHWDPARPVRVEKSPPNLLRFRLLQHLFPGALCVAVVRHPIAVAESTRAKRRRGRLLPLRGLVEHWLHSHELFAADRTRIHRLVELRYEDLVSDPVSGMDPVFEQLGLSPIASPERVDPGRDRAHGERWRARLRRPSRLGPLLALEGRVAPWGYSLAHFGSEVR
jgi:hypothetical protein